MTNKQPEKKGGPIWLPLAKLLIGGFIATFIYRSLVTSQDSFFEAAANADIRFVVFAVALCTAYRLFNAHGWSMVISAFGDELETTQALKIWLMSEACRWLPGSVWNYGARAVQATANGVRKSNASISLVVELLFGLLSWIIVGCFGLGYYSHIVRDAIARFNVTPSLGPIAAGVVGVLAFALMMYLVRSRISALVQRLIAAFHLRPNWRKLAISQVYYVLLGTLNGLAFLAVIRAVVPDANIPTSAVIGANAIAWLVGFFAIFAPGGLVVREATLAALLVIWLPNEAALAAAILWRTIQIFVEIACIGILQFSLFVKRSLVKIEFASTEPMIAAT